MPVNRRLVHIGRLGLLVVTLSGAVNAAAAHAQVTRIDVGPGGVPANAPSYSPVVSFDGRYVAFVSGATNLTPGDTNRMFDFFRYDRQTGELIRGAPPFARPMDAIAMPLALSADGRWLLFNDAGTGWVADDHDQTADVFQYDFTTSQARRVSVATGGIPANGASAAHDMSADGRYIAFYSRATNLSPPALAHGPVFNVFVHDAQTQTTVQVSHGVGNVPANGPVYAGRISPDGEWVAFGSEATNLSTEPDTNGTADVYLARWRTGEIYRVGPYRTSLTGFSGAGLPTWDGALVEFTSSALNAVPGANGREDLFVWDRRSGSVSYATPLIALPGELPDLSISVYGRYVTRTQLGAPRECLLVHYDRLAGRSAAIASQFVAWQMSLDGRFVVWEAFVGAIYLRDVGVPREGLLPDGDADGDGLPNGWEERFGLDAESALTDNGPDGDPDHDGLTNQAELAARTHPRGLFTRYFAEGARGAFFQTRFALFNPDATPANVLVRTLGDDTTTAAESLVVPARTRRTVTPDSLSGLKGASFSTVIESDVPIVADRTMSWGAGSYGAHSETGILAPAQAWYFAEGSTSGEFSLFYLLQNPQTSSVDVTIRYVRPMGLTPIAKTYTLPALSRTTIAVDGEGSELASTDVAAVIQAAQPIIAERAMYLNRPGQPFAAGHGSAGVTAPSTRWFMAEGATGTFFDLFILLLNPGDRTATVDVRYLTASGETFVKPYTLGPHSRTTIWVDDEQVPGFGRVLADIAVATLVESTNTVPIVVERTMWWPDGDWYEGHNTAGATAAGPRWAIADGDVGTSRFAQTFVLLANTSSFAGDVLVTVMLEDGTSQARIFTVNASTRVNVDVANEFWIPASQPFGVLVEALGSTPIDLVVERSTYWNTDRVHWAGGTNALAARLP